MDKNDKDLKERKREVYKKCKRFAKQIWIPGQPAGTKTSVPYHKRERKKWMKDKQY